MSLRTLDKKTLLSSVTADGAGSAFSVERSKGWTFVIVSSSVTSGATIDIEAYLSDSSAWHVIHSEAVTGDGSIMVRDDMGHYEKIRAKVSSRVDGTYSVYATGTVESL
jgi:hypothetical protein